MQPRTRAEYDTPAHQHGAMRLRSLLFLLLAFFSIQTRAQSQPAPAQDTAQESATVISAAETSYILLPGDSIEVLYRYTPEYNQTVSVQPDGTVALSLLGTIPVRGLSLEQARQRIMREAAKRLNDPDVSLALRDFIRPHFTVLGEVANPGRYELRGNISTIDGVALAGGLKNTARHTRILLIHRINDTIGETQLLDFKSLEKNPRPGRELTGLRDGDLIIVPVSKFGKVERIVKLANIGAYYPIR